jgi:hypothetical protein
MTLNVFMLTVDYDRATFIAVLDATPLIRNWLSVLDDGVLVASHEAGVALQTFLHEQLPSHHFFLSHCFSWNVGGWLPQGIWDFIANPTDSGKHPPLHPLGVPGLIPDTANAVQNPLTGFWRGDK